MAINVFGEKPIPELRYWSKITVVNYEDPPLWITLSDTNVTCQLWEDGTMSLTTVMPSKWYLGPKPVTWWTEHMQEALQIGRYYYGDKWGFANP